MCGSQQRGIHRSWRVCTYVCVCVRTPGRDRVRALSVKNFRSRGLDQAACAWACVMTTGLRSPHLRTMRGSADAMIAHCGPLAVRDVSSVDRSIARTPAHKHALGQRGAIITIRSCGSDGGGNKQTTTTPNHIVISGSNGRTAEPVVTHICINHMRRRCECGCGT